MSMTLTRHHKLSLIAALATAIAVPSLAAADRDRDDRRSDRSDRRGMRGTHIGDVGTHVHVAEDYVPVNTRQRFERIELRAEGHAVRMDGLQVQFDDGRIYKADLRRTIHPGQRVVVDVPSYSPIKMLVLDYANRGPHYRAREDARVSVRGLMSTYRDRHDVRDRRSDRDRRDRTYDNRPVDNRFQWSGGVYIRVRG
jgi:hypothetical protein